MQSERRNSVVYQIYPRSFQDSNGDGIGDIAGITSRLEYLARLGVDAIWLSPIFKSPNFDFGYDVSDYTDVDPDYGTIADVDELVQKAHALGVQVLFDIVPCHTSIEHPWFRERPDFYIWSPTDGPPNNWESIFGGSAWAQDPHGRGWYLHTFYAEQPNLNWRNPEVRTAITDAMAFWLDRGVDGFRIDAVPALLVDEALRDNPPYDAEFAATIDMATRLSMMDQPEVGPAMAELRAALPNAFLVVEAVVPTAKLGRYLENSDLGFCFEFLHAPFNVDALRSVIDEAANVPGIAWVLSNHDFSRLVTRWGVNNARCAAFILLTLPGAAFIYQGDEIGMLDGPGGLEPYDRFGRDNFRHPMQWNAEGGFTTGTSWLPMTDPQRCNAEDQVGSDGSMFELYRDLIEARKGITGDLQLLDADTDVLAFKRNDHVVVVNFGSAVYESPFGGAVMLASDAATTAQCVSSHGAVLLRV